MASRKIDTWMPLYIGDYLRDTGRLTTLQHGAYLLLIFDYWMKGPPPDDNEVLAAITKLPEKEWTAKHRRAVQAFFQVADGLWRHDRIDQELLRSRVLTEARAEAGRAGADAKHGKDGGKKDGKRMANDVAEGVANPQQNDGPSPSQSSTPSLRSGALLVLDGGSGKPNPGVSKNEAPTTPLWNAYSAAFEARYKVKPLRGPKESALLKSFLRTIPAEEAPGIIAFYLRSNERWYVQKKHPIGSLVNDAGKLRTEWLTGSHGTEAQARQADRTQATANVFAPMLEEARLKEAANGK